MALPEELSVQLATAEPDKFELVARIASGFVGLKVRPKAVTIGKIKPLICEACQFRKAAKKGESKP